MTEEGLKLPYGKWERKGLCFFVKEKSKSIICNHISPGKVRKSMISLEAAIKGLESQHQGLPRPGTRMGSVTARQGDRRFCDPGEGHRN